MPKIEAPLTREETIARLQREPLDLLVVGGGIVGAGCARDAAMRGLRVALVEQYDFAQGTSSRTSRLLHGGLRYLAQGHVGLVREASHEKRILHRIAPHLCDPLAFVFPAYRGGQWPLWQLRIGVKLYDMLAGGSLLKHGNLGSSQGLGAEQTRAFVPGIRRDGLRGSVRYFDAMTNDARLVIDTLRSAARHEALLLNQMRYVEGRPGPARWQVTLQDALADREIGCEATVIVNATGPWAPSIPQSGLRLRLTKGVHLVIERGRLPVADAVVLTQGSRILFAIPWGERTILGTTDTDYEGRPEDVATAEEDIEQVLAAVNHGFPDAAIRRDEVIRTWAGLRPLIDSGRGKPSDISRAHEIRSPKPGWIDVAGGKLTTYRHIARQTIDAVLQQADMEQRPCTTADEPLLPELTVPSPRPSAAAAPSVDPTSGIIPPDPSREIIARFCHEQWAVHLDDVMRRRANWHYWYRDPFTLAEQVSQWMAAALDWSEQTRQDELANYRAAPD